MLSTGQVNIIARLLCLRCSSLIEIWYWFIIRNFAFGIASNPSHTIIDLHLSLFECGNGLILNAYLCIVFLLVLLHLSYSGLFDINKCKFDFIDIFGSFGFDKSTL